MSYGPKRDELKQLEREAEAEYDAAMYGQCVRRERRRVWNGKRYVMSMVNVYDFGKSARVEPSEKSHVVYVHSGPELPARRGHTIDDILDCIDEHGPSTLAELHRLMDTPTSTIGYALSKSDGVSRADDRRWHLADIPYEPDVYPKWNLIEEHLTKHGASTVLEISAELKLSQSAVYKSLKSNPDKFVVVAIALTAKFKKRAHIWDILLEWT